MKEIIILNISEQSPNEEKARLNRTGQLSLELASNDQKVIWIGSNFSHQSKRYLNNSERKDLKNIKFYFLKSLAYKNNISLVRVLNNILLAIQASFILFNQKQPKMVYSYTPPIEIAFVAACYCKFSKTLFALDVRDNWPDSFVALFPNPFKWTTRLLFFPWRRMLFFTLKHADKILASSKLQAEFAQKYLNESDKEIRVFYIGDNVPEIKFQPKYSNSIKLLFIGTLTDARPLFETIKNLNSIDNKNIFLDIIGDGDNLRLYKKLAKSNKNIKFHGRKTGNDLTNFVQDSDILIAPYEKGGYGWSMPAKISSYIGFGRPIITNIGNETKEILESYSLGSIIDFNNLEDFSNALNRWADVDRPNHFTKARAVYEKNFNMKVITKSMIDYIFEVQ